MLKQPDVVKQLQESTIEPIGSTPAEMAQFMKEDRQHWSSLVRATNTTMD
jgi:tripartite-type tricarboxylate transporter receptor subunit TctC